MICKKKKKLYILIIIGKQKKKKKIFKPNFKYIKKKFFFSF